MDLAENDVILFSFGVTGFDSRVLPDNFLKILFEAFSKLDETVIMRLDTSKISNNVAIPNNVISNVWIPQQALLGMTKLNKETNNNTKRSVI